MHIGLYGAINYTVAGIAHQTSESVLNELAKEKNLINNILENANYYFKNEIEIYFTKSLTVYQQVFNRLKEDPINEPENLLKTIQENHLTYLLESECRIDEVISALRQQKKDKKYQRFSSFLNTSINNYTTIKQNIKTIKSLNSRQCQKKMVRETVLLLVDADNQLINYPK